jgi:hypothetical protein
LEFNSFILSSSRDIDAMIIASGAMIDDGQPDGQMGPE